MKQQQGERVAQKPGELLPIAMVTTRENMSHTFPLHELQFLQAAIALLN
jgi:hypothetical protein